MNGGSPAKYAVLWSIFALLAVVLIYPIWLTVQGGFTSVQPGGGFTLWHVLEVFRDPDLRAGILNALLIATCTTFLATVVSMPLAIIAARHDFPGKGVFAALVLIPLILPPFVGAIGVKHILGRYGSLNTFMVDWGILDAPIDFLGSIIILFSCDRICFLTFLNKLGE